jgi:phage baseplate assembly protein W
MAIKQTNIFPIDLQPRNAVGIAFPFSSFAVSGSATPFKLNYTTKDQIKSNLIVYFSTNKGERPLNPNYGGGLKNILFEQLTSNTANVVEKIIKDELAAQFPEVQLKNLEILEDPDSYTLTVVMSYVLLNNEEDTLEINFNT